MLRLVLRLVLRLRLTWAAALLVAAVPVRALEAGEPAPAFTLQSREGQAISLASLRGHYVYVDFWASWCPPCRLSFPWMNRLQARYAASGLKVLAISVDTDEDAARRFLDQAAPAFTVLFNGDAYTPGAYDVDTMPTAFLIDPAGTVLFVRRSFRRSENEALEQMIGVALGVVDAGSSPMAAASASSR